MEEKDLAKEWRPVMHQGKITNYMISNYGEVIDINTNQSPPCYLVKNKYRAKLKINGKETSKYIHRMVAEAFCVNQEPKTLIHVEHLDGNTLNNIATNLVWVKSHPSEAYSRTFKVLIRKSKYKFNNR